MLINKIDFRNTNSVYSKNVLQKTNLVSFTGTEDTFETKPKAIFGSFSQDEIKEITDIVHKNKSFSSGYASCVYKYSDDKIIKTPKDKTYPSADVEVQAQGQNLKEYYALSKINEIDSAITTKPLGIIQDKNSYYLVEEFIEGSHPHKEGLTNGHVEDLLSKFLKLDTNGITNADLQSGNIFLLDNNKTKLIDFGSYNFIANNGEIWGSDNLPFEIFKPNAQIYKDTNSDIKTRFLKTFLTDNYEDIKNMTDNPYLKVQSNATNFEFRTLYSYLLSGKEENPLEFFKNYLKSKAQNYHQGLKEFIEQLNFEDIDLSGYEKENIDIAKENLKNAIDYQDLIKSALLDPTDETIKVELSKIQLRTFLNLGDSLNSPVENAKKLQDSYNQLITALNDGIKNSEGKTKEYYLQTLKYFEDKFKNYDFIDGQTKTPDSENLVKMLFKNTVEDIKEVEPETIKETAETLGNKTKSNKKWAVLAAAAVAIVGAIAIAIKLLKSKKNAALNTSQKSPSTTTQMPVNNSINPLNNMPDTFSKFKNKG